MAIRTSFAIQEPGIARTSSILAISAAAQGEMMSGFEFLFSFYSLLLGLAVARVATGLADSWRTRTRTRFGASTLLLGLLVLLSAAQQWLSFWGGRDVLTMGPWQVLTSMGMSLPYIFISQAMLPHEHEACTHLDDYYLQNRRPLLLALLVPPVVSLSYNASIQGLHWGYVIAYGVPLLVPVLLLAARRQWQHRLGLAVLLVNLLGMMFS